MGKGFFDEITLSQGHKGYAASSLGDKLTKPAPISTKIIPLLSQDFLFLLNLPGFRASLIGICLGRRIHLNHNHLKTVNLAEFDLTRMARIFHVKSLSF